VTDDAIRDLLARFATHTMDLRPGWLAVSFGRVQAHGGDLEAVRTWVEAHGGRVHGAPQPGPSGLRPGRVVESASTTTDPRRFIFPASALTQAA
jgi:hypothetical protein